MPWTRRACVSSQTRRPATSTNAPSAVASWVMRPHSSVAAAASLACHTRLQSRRSVRPHDLRRTVHSPQARVVRIKLPVEHLCGAALSPTPREQTAMRAPACETARRPCTAAAARQPQAACTWVAPHDVSRRLARVRSARGAHFLPRSEIKARALDGIMRMWSVSLSYSTCVRVGRYP